MRNNVKIDKKDFLRALLTDTYPTDVPLIFSNDGLYINLNLINKNSPIYKIIDQIITRESEKIGDEIANLQAYIPFKYNIKKDEHKLRTLSLIHPASQYTYSLFYRDYAKTINYLCSLSPISIRAPVKITNSFYLKDGHINNKYKEINIETIHDEIKRKHASSFFTYKGFTRIYHFYKNDNFLELEKRFPLMWNLDVSNCFNNIYSHSVEWAIKGKEYSKYSILITQRFAAILDKTMQYSNDCETNGIPIGCEFSRVFAEIIFQRIDRNIINSLSEKGFEYNESYKVCRYVDDFILFAKNKNIADLVYKEINDKLGEYNLYLGDSKLKKYSRPFITEKSDAIIKASFVLKEMDDIIFDRDFNDNKIIKKLHKIKCVNKLSMYIINKIKIITPESSNYSGLSSYVVSSICNKLSNICSDYGVYSCGEYDDKNLKSIIITLYNILFFFFYATPSISSSMKVTKSTILINDLLINHHDDIRIIIADFISNNINSMSLLEFDDENENRDGYLSIERVNMLILLSYLGDKYLPKKRYLMSIVNNKKNLDYFSIVSFLFVIKNNPDFFELKEIIESKIKDIFNNKKNKISKYSEKTHLMLDVLSCPYVSLNLREYVYEQVISELNIVRNAQQITSDCLEFLNIYWFVKWEKLDLVNLLERKELKSHYI
ncbi:TPA: antiviral reverse transcriptase Drt3b [Providencia alcalifaciens]